MQHNPPPQGGRGSSPGRRDNGRTWPLIALLTGLIAALVYQYRAAIPVELLSVAALLALCGGMHVFMHRGGGHRGRGHGGHGRDGHERNRSIRKDDWPDEDDRGTA